MTQDTRLKGNKDLILAKLERAKASLQRALKDIQTAQDALAPVRAVRKTVKEAQKLAANGPEFHAKPLPKRVRAALEGLAKAIDKAEKSIEETPVTADERVAARAKKEKEKRTEQDAARSGHFRTLR